MNEKTEGAYCHNCHRVERAKEDFESNEGHDAYVLDVNAYHVDEDGVFRRAFCNLKARDYRLASGGYRAVYLCAMCRRYFACTSEGDFT